MITGMGTAAIAADFPLRYAADSTNTMGVNTERTSPNRAPGCSLQPAAPPAAFSSHFRANILGPPRRLPVRIRHPQAAKWPTEVGKKWPLLQFRGNFIPRCGRSTSVSRKHFRAPTRCASSGRLWHALGGFLLPGGSSSIPHRGFLEISGLGLDVPLAVVLTLALHVRII